MTDERIERAAQIIREHPCLATSCFNSTDEWIDFSRDIAHAVLDVVDGEPAGVPGGVHDALVTAHAEAKRACSGVLAARAGLQYVIDELALAASPSATRAALASSEPKENSSE
jgi:hypothetical protein